MEDDFHHQASTFLYYRRFEDIDEYFANNGQWIVREFCPILNFEIANAGVRETPYFIKQIGFVFEMPVYSALVTPAAFAIAANEVDDTLAAKTIAGRRQESVAGFQVPVVWFFVP